MMAAAARSLACAILALTGAGAIARTPVVDHHPRVLDGRVMDSIHDGRADPSRIERFVLVVAPVGAGRDYEVAFDGHAGFLDVVQPCLDPDLVPLSWSTAHTSRHTVDETRYRATPAQAASFASCVGRNAAPTEG